eukprot:CAMPEP_0201569884 /NCGR_PEP_ID=MMETSP0190_2-20130828/11827_1 /ASSEMBLY_ACC=CAM_ASM_000263 /TAXON_ID=37353 /ORGANISM="Rosalina sp." /LENGTH=168 /DNA_ID=CAMNT_0047992753 /DNA_START=256 /DNA_END=762 /DNA_ORIENTATION=-
MSAAQILPQSTGMTPITLYTADGQARIAYVPITPSNVTPTNAPSPHNNQSFSNQSSSPRDGHNNQLTHSHTNRLSLQIPPLHEQQQLEPHFKTSSSQESDINIHDKVHGARPPPSSSSGARSRRSSDSIVSSDGDDPLDNKAKDYGIDIQTPIEEEEMAMIKRYDTPL